MISGSTSTFRRRSWSRVGLIASVFLAIWSVKLVVIDRYGTDLPYWDQWAKEGELFYAPWFDRHEFWKNLFIPHNEHRIAPTLALNWALLRLGGDQWDARVQCVASAALHALLMAGIAAWAWRTLAPKRPPGNVAPAGNQSRGLGKRVTGLSLFLVLLAAPPIAWENVLGGFQSQFYFLAIFSLLAIAGFIGERAWTWRWCGAVACAALAGVSMGSGMLLAAPVGVIMLGRLINAGLNRQGQTGDHGRRGALATLAIALAIGGIGWAFRSPAPWHAGLHAHSFAEYGLYAARCLSWPLYDQLWLAALFWAPWLALVGHWCRHIVCLSDPREAVDRRTMELLLAGGLWVLTQVAAVCYSRAGTGTPAPRYGDIMALGLAFNAITLLWFARRTAGQAPNGVDALSARAVRALPWLWMTIVAVTVAIATREVIHDPLPTKKAQFVAYEHNTQAFVLTNDYAALEKAMPQIPFPLADWFARMIRNPSLRRLLPESVREPIPVQGFEESHAPDAHTPGAATQVTAFPELDHRRTKTLSAPAEWRSGPVPAMSGWWKIETAGDIGQPGAVLELRSARDDHVLATIAPTKPAGGGWRAAYVPAPRQPARLYARLAEPADRLAFSEPIEMSSLSFWTWRLVEHAGWLVLVSVVGFVTCALAALRIRAR